MADQDGQLTGLFPLIVCRVDCLFFLPEPFFLLLFRLLAILQIAFANEFNFLLFLFDFLIFIFLLIEQLVSILLQPPINVLHAFD